MIDAALYEFADDRTLIEAAAYERLDAILETAKRQIGLAASPFARVVADWGARAAMDMLAPNPLYNLLASQGAAANTAQFGGSYGYGCAGSALGQTFGIFGRWL